MRLSILFAIALVAGTLTGDALAKPGKAARNDKSIPPRLILIIRHAEKPAADDNSVHLSPTGIQRAERLHELFESTAEKKDPFPKPDFILAAKDSKKSHRPTETVAVLARKLHLTVEATFEDDDVENAARTLLRTPQYGGKTILVCWRHGNIPELARALGVAEVPGKWKDEVFDRVWQISFDADGKAALVDRPQHLLPGDSEK